MGRPRLVCAVDGCSDGEDEDIIVACVVAAYAQHVLAEYVLFRCRFLYFHLHLFDSHFSRHSSSQIRTRRKALPANLPGHVTHVMRLFSHLSIPLTPMGVAKVRRRLMLNVGVLTPLLHFPIFLHGFRCLPFQFSVNLRR